MTSTDFSWQNLDDKLQQKPSLCFDQISAMSSSSSESESAQYSIIFDSADVTTAIIRTIEHLTVNQSRLKVLLVQETLRENFLVELNENIQRIPFADAGKNKSDYSAVTKMYGGTILQSVDWRVTFIVDVPAHVAHESTDVVVVQFFRTAKEGVQLANALEGAAVVSLWTEKISLAYEVVAKLNAVAILLNTNDSGEVIIGRANE